MRQIIKPKLQFAEFLLNGHHLRAQLRDITCKEQNAPESLKDFLPHGAMSLLYLP